MASAAVHMVGEFQATCCGQAASNHFLWTTKPAEVTCKRCLKVMDRNEQGKASPHQTT